MIYVVIEDDTGLHYLKFVTLMSAAYYLKNNNKSNYTISDFPVIEVDEQGNEITPDESDYRLI